MKKKLKNSHYPKENKFFSQRNRIAKLNYVYMNTVETGKQVLNELETIFNSS